MIRDEIETQIKETIKKGQKPTFIILSDNGYCEFLSMMLPQEQACTLREINYHGIPIGVDHYFEDDKIEIRSCDPRD